MSVSRKTRKLLAKYLDQTVLVKGQQHQIKHILSCHSLIEETDYSRIHNKNLNWKIYDYYAAFYTVFTDKAVYNLYYEDFKKLKKV